MRRLCARPTTTMTDKPLANLMPALYSFRLEDIQRVGQQHGYAIAVHGSMQRDLDMVAFPWRAIVSYADELVAALCEALPAETLPDDPEIKLHGRLAYTLLMGGNLFMDLSVIPGDRDPRRRDQ